MRSSRVDSIAEFDAQGRHYHIYAADEYRRDADDCSADRVVGELTINEKRHLIIAAGTGRSNKAAAGDGNRLNLLTKRELQIVVMVARGLVNKVIADRLHISEWTVSTHLRRIFAKLRVDSRAEMVYHCATLIDDHHDIPD